MALYTIFLIIFNFLYYFLGGLEHHIASWISYVFIHISYFSLIFISRLVNQSNHRVTLNNSLNFLSLLHFFITFVIGLIIIWMNKDSYKMSLTIHVIITGVYMILLLINILYNENTLEAERKLENELKYVKEGCQNIKDILRETEDLEIKKDLENLYDYLHSSPVSSSNESQKIESVILEKISTLKKQMKTCSKEEFQNRIKQILKDAQERNQKL